MLSPFLFTCLSPPSETKYREGTNELGTQVREGWEEPLGKIGRLLASPEVTKERRLFGSIIEPAV